MLAISSKLTDPVQFSNSINQYCDAAFGPESVRSLTSFTHTVDELRLEAVMGTNTVEAQRNGLRRYLGALQLIEEKFPIGQPVHPHTKIQFPQTLFVWADSFRPRIKTKGSSARFERACVLFNFAANQSLLARDTDRSTPDGQKLALQLFQASAGIYILLRDQIVPQCIAAGDPIGTDLSDNAISMCASLMLAQAQAIFYEKAVKDKSSRSLLAKLANQASNFYATSFLSANQLSEHIDPSWAAHAKFQELLFLSAAHFQQAMSDKPNVVAKLSGFGPLVSRLRFARDIANQIDSIPNLAQNIIASIKPLRDAIAAELSQLEYDNANVYMEMVPERNLLAPIGLVPAVKATTISLSELVDMSYVAPFVDLIDKLAPIEMKKKLEFLDNETNKIVNKFAETVGTFRLPPIPFPLAPGVPPVAPGSPSGPESGWSINDEMWSKIARIQVIGGSLALDGQLATLHGLTGECEGMIVAINRALDEEERDDKNCRERFGPLRFNRNPSNQINGNLRAQLSNYRQKLNMAIETNRKVRDRIASQDKSLVGVLGKSRNEIDAIWAEKRLAAKQQIAARALNPETENLKEICRMAVEKLESFIAQCKKKSESFSTSYGANSGRLGELMRSADADQFSKSLIEEANKDSHAVTSQMMSQYSELTAEVDKACGTLISKVNDASPTSGMTAYLNANWSQALDTCATIVLQGFSDVAEGVGFFNKLSDHLKKLKIQVDDFCFARNEEKNGVLQNIQRGLAGAENTESFAGQGAGYGGFDAAPSAPPQINFGGSQ
jgi:programmed cell death 6-interacting protein